MTKMFLAIILIRLSKSLNLHISMFLRTRVPYLKYHDLKKKKRRYIQKLWGHHRPETTMRYTHVSKTNARSVQSPLDNIEDTQML